MSFHTNGSEAMRITSDGKVGIGTTSVDTNLHIESSSGSATVRVEASSSEKGDLQANSGNITLRTIGSYPLVFNTNQTERARIDANGNFGIGTTSPGSELHVVADNVSESWSPYDGTVLTIENNDTDGCILQTVGRNTATNEIWFGDDDSRNIGRIRYEHSNDGLEFWTNGSEKLRIDSNGRQTFNGSSTTSGHGNFVGEVGSSFRALAFEHTNGGGIFGHVTTNGGGSV